MGERAGETRFHALGVSGAAYEGLETFDRPKGVASVVMESDEVTAVCPVTGQPDWYKVTITYIPLVKCLESKSLKLFLQSFRGEGIFAESLADTIAAEVIRALDATRVDVVVDQKPRGGVRVVAKAVRSIMTEGR